MNLDRLPQQLALWLIAAYFPAWTAASDDWPMWRYDANRSAASNNALPEKLSLLWERQYDVREQAWDDPLNLDLMTYDRVFEPIVMDGRMFVGFNDRDKLQALDAATGKELWSAFAEAPVRLPPVGWKDRVFFCSDDGFLYCVGAATGELLWKFSGAPNSQHAIGNRRLVSAWPARGGPVVRDGTVYFAASIWPFMGTFLYALNAETGHVEWVNDHTGAQYIKQPHSAPSFAGVAPQGAMVATDDLLIVPGGRSVPAVFDRHSGELLYFEINAGGKGTGGSFVTADDNYFYVHTREKGTRAFELDTGLKTAFMPNEPVLSDDRIYSAEIDGGQPIVRTYDTEQQVLWEVAADGQGDLILAGDTLVAAGDKAITLIRLPGDNSAAGINQPGRVVDTVKLNAPVHRLLVAHQQLFAITLDGRITAFGIEAHETSHDTPDSPKNHVNNELPRVRLSHQQVAARLLAKGDAEGYAFWFGDATSPVLRAIASESPFEQLAVVDHSSQRVDRLRRKLDAVGKYGSVTAHEATPVDFRAPKYVAHMLFVSPELVRQADDISLANLFDSVRPYGGVMHLLLPNGQAALGARLKTLDLEQADISVHDLGVSVRRVGALPGSADWTHQYGDIANTVKSDDTRVKLPLGVLWFGGSSNMDVLPRHGHGPPEQVVGGRLFIEGMNCLSARDVYTGRVLWKREFQELGTFDVYYDATYENTPLNPKYNQVHIPGANGRGTNYVATEDRVYILEGDVCHVLDPRTGQTLLDIRLPTDDSGQQMEWGYIGVFRDVLLGGMGFANFRARHELNFESDKQLRGSRAGFGSKSLDRAGSAALIAFDRHSGEQLWQVEANHSFWHNGIVAGGDLVYCLDKNPAQIEQAMLRRGLPMPASYRIAALDYQTGQVQWEIQEGIFGSWLGYSAEHDKLLQAGAAASDRLYAEVGQGMSVYNGRDGSLVWKNDSLQYAGPCILHHDLIITNANSYSESAGAFYIENGQQKLVKNPLTGEIQPWKVTRAYGCNNIIASENMLTFRSGAAGFYDLTSEAGTGNLGGFKSGCTSNLVVANGVLNAPDYTRTCSCAYQNQTSLGLVHMPDIEMWSVHAGAADASRDKEIQALAINFGAPGDRMDKNGTLWLEYPAVAGESPPVSIELNSEAEFYQHHSSVMHHSDRPWLFASGVENISHLWLKMRLENPFRLDESGLPVAHPNDDAEESENGAVSLGSSDLELVRDGDNQTVGVRFQDIPLPRGAEIRSAHIQFTCDEPSSESTALLITAEGAGNPAEFSTSSHDLSARQRLTQEVAWQPEAWSEAGASSSPQRTPELRDLVQAIVNQDDWQAGQAMAFFFDGEGKRTATSSKGPSLAAPRLVIDADLAASSGDSQSGQSGQSYNVYLHFAAPPTLPSESRRFDIYAQGKLVVENLQLDATQADGEPAYSHLLPNVQINVGLELKFVAKTGVPVLSGVEIHRAD